MEIKQPQFEFYDNCIVDVLQVIKKETKMSDKSINTVLFYANIKHKDIKEVTLEILEQFELWGLKNKNYPLLQSIYKQKFKICQRNMP